jgi:hypothetical protein
VVQFILDKYSIEARFKDHLSSIIQAKQPWQSTALAWAIECNFIVPVFSPPNSDARLQHQEDKRDWACQFKYVYHPPSHEHKH